YILKAGTARYCGHRIFAIEDKNGSLTPKELKQLYMTRVDCHSIQGCDISPDVEDVHVKKLREVQVSFLRRMLNLCKKSMLAPLYTETRIMPLCARRLLLALRFLQYLISLDFQSYAHIALCNSIDLAGQGRKSWAGDIMLATQKLPFSVSSLALIHATAESVALCIKDVESGVKEWLESQVDVPPTRL
ncbi:hypothetical protein FPV67DRAFT_1409896, partial [Lyophyllum atratum]